MKFSNKCVICIFVFALLFVATMTVAFIITGSEPSTLIASVFAFIGFEAGVLGHIKVSETKTKKKKKSDKSKKENETK